ALSRWATHLRGGLRDLSAGVPGASLVPGFAVGDTSLGSEQLNAAMQQGSLTHLVAVSGANCALVVSAMASVVARLGVG
ncbi:ComEC/Rec2 family competence protein, partial [Leucobacter celer]|uniref:ComEC/Rec2 family competence protein n=1 Tax=Leucobacter celer TaxID=668625 RepID=UPI000A604216